jgi:hypothetical protein
LTKFHSFQVGKFSTVSTSEKTDGQGRFAQARAGLFLVQVMLGLDARQSIGGASGRDSDGAEARFQRDGNRSSIKLTMTRPAAQRFIARANKTRTPTTGRCLMTEDTLTKAAMSSLKIATGAVLMGAMTVLLWVAVIELLD